MKKKLYFTATLCLLFPILVPVAYSVTVRYEISHKKTYALQWAMAERFTRLQKRTDRALTTRQINGVLPKENKLDPKTTNLLKEALNTGLTGDQALESLGTNPGIFPPSILISRYTRYINHLFGTIRDSPETKKTVIIKFFKNTEFGQDLAWLITKETLLESLKSVQVAKAGSVLFQSGTEEMTVQVEVNYENRVALLHALLNFRNQMKVPGNESWLTIGKLTLESKDEGHDYDRPANFMSGAMPSVR